MPKTGTALLFRCGGIGGGDKGATRVKKKRYAYPSSVWRLAKADATTTVVLSQLYAAVAAAAELVRTNKNDLRNRGTDDRNNMRSLGSALLIRKLSTKSPVATGVLKINFFPVHNVYKAIIETLTSNSTYCTRTYIL